MANYCIMVDNGRHPIEPCFLELPDVEAARMEAARLLRAMLKDEAEDFWQTERWQVGVQREGLLLFELHALVVDAPAMGRRRG